MTTNTPHKPRKNAAAKPAATKTPAGKTSAGKTATLHFYVLLDRSGSMASMVDDVIGGFNNFVAEQQTLPGKVRFTVVQFDSQDPHDIIADAAPVKAVNALTRDTFRPRGGTPLLDATGELIAKAMGRAEQRRVLGRSAEDITVITITDGEENQSRRFTLDQIRTLIGDRTEAGWGFVYLGAGIDAYGDAQRLGYDTRAVQTWAADGVGANTMFASVSRAASQMRADLDAGRAVDKADWFRGLKEAEVDKQQRT